MMLHAMMLTSVNMMLLFPWIQGKCHHAYSQRSYKLVGHMINSLQRSEIFQCIDVCSLNGKCRSINFYKDIRTCELNDANHLSNPESLLYSQGSEYLNYFLRPIIKCSDKLCRKQQRCEVTEDGLHYKCLDPEALNFPTKSIENKVILENPFYKDLNAFTVALWVQIDPSTDEHVPFSYAVNETDPLTDSLRHNEIAFFLRKSRTGFGIANEYLEISSISIVDGNWHHMALSWTNINGAYNFYIDGINTKNGTEHIGHVVNKGAIVLGQDQDIYLGGFQELQSFQGNMTSVNVWDKVLTAQEISGLAMSCPSGEGNVVKWSDLKNKGEGAVELVHNSECRHFK